MTIIKKIIFAFSILILIVFIIIFLVLSKLLTAPAPIISLTPTPPIISPLSPNLSCNEMYNKIENNLDQANYCGQDSDCDVIMLGGAYIEFGCGHYINKQVDKELFYNQMKIYDQKCDTMINDCGPVAVAASCVTGKCVPLDHRPTSDLIISSDTLDWATYQNDKLGMEFQYPKKLTITTDGNKIILNHSIPYENTGSCDMTGGGQYSATLNDFNVSLEIVPQNLTLNYIDGEYEIGTLKGSFVNMGAEGCGYILYYFPIAGNKTLVTQKDNVQALMRISTAWDTEEILKIPGVITMEESKKIFQQILSSLKFIKQ